MSTTRGAKCSGRRTHSYTYLGEPGTSSRSCIRCGATNPRYRANADPHPCSHRVLHNGKCVECHEDVSTADGPTPRERYPRGTGTGAPATRSPAYRGDA